MENTNLENNTNLETHIETHEGTEHQGPHIPSIQGVQIFGTSYISTTVFSTFIFLIIILIVSIIGNRALKNKKSSKLKLFFITYIKYADNYLRDSFGNRKDSRKYFGLIVGIFSIILFGNLFGLIIDWLGTIYGGILGYMRPINSDLNTTLILALTTIVTLIIIEFKTHGGLKTAKNYFFNFSGGNFIEKCVNVFVGWLHLLSLPSSVLSLSLRLFGNIFAGVVLIGVIGYLLALATSSFFEVGRLMTIPFWFFELFVAFVQALVFAGLMVAYFKNAKSGH